VLVQVRQADLLAGLVGAPGTVGTCTFRPASTVCRASAGPCDVAESCTGSSAACPGDSFLSNTTTCRAAAGVCDVAEQCPGTSPNCPSDVRAGSSTVCRASAGVCDVAEYCDGTNVTCPGDVLLGAGNVCRAAAGPCDVSESCTGSSATCPTDGKRPNGTVCLTASGVCDVDDTCDGTTNGCTARYAAASTVCRAVAGPCDVAENCTGSSTACPGDGYQPEGTSCGATTCSNGVYTPGPRCSPTPTCSPQASSSCNGYACNGSNCWTSCTSDAQCMGTHYCSGNVCTPKKANGQACGAANQCTSNFCTDGVCCESSCTGGCQYCGGASPGVCKNQAQGTDPEGACGTYTCNGAGSCYAGCSGQSACTNYCKSGNYCNGTACVAKKGTGNTCGSICECSSNFCVDGYCCNSACTGGCEACNRSGSLGTCSNHTGGTDPENACGQYQCNGSGACHASCSAICSTFCKSTAHCTAGACVADWADTHPCSTACECTSAVCNPYYYDNDGDGFGAGAASYFCGSTGPTNYRSQNGDCCETDNRAFPGTTAWYSSTRTGCGGYDFDCDTVEEERYTTVNACQQIGACTGTRDCIDSPASGYLGSTAPACGSSATWVLSCGLVASACSPILCPGCVDCNRSTTSRTQTCH
jgi:hypothetical protein